MNQSAASYLDEEEVDDNVKPREGEPPFFCDPIPLMNQVTLFFGRMGVRPEIIQELVRMKTDRRDGKGKGIIYCNEAEQKVIESKLFDIARDQEWKRDNAFHVGRHVASGLTKPSDFSLAFTINEDEAKVGFNSSHADGA